MPNQKEVCKCGICGNIVEVLYGNIGQLVCCGEPMVLQAENTVDASKEKHAPVIEKTEKGFKVKVGSVQHPMAVFKIDAVKVSAREYCNLHGLWKI